MRTSIVLFFILGSILLFSAVVEGFADVSSEENLIANILREKRSPQMPTVTLTDAAGRVVQTIPIPPAILAMIRDTLTQLTASK